MLLLARKALELCWTSWIVDSIAFISTFLTCGIYRIVEFGLKGFTLENLTSIEPSVSFEVW